MKCWRPCKWSFDRNYTSFSRKYEICIFSWNHFEKSSEFDHHRLSWKQKWWLNDRVVDRGTVTIPWFSRAFAICIFGWNVEDPEIGHLIGIEHHLVGDYKSARFVEIIFKSLWTSISIDSLGSTSGVRMTWYTIGTVCSRLMQYLLNTQNAIEEDLIGRW